MRTLITMVLMVLTFVAFADEDPRTFLSLHVDFIGENSPKSLVRAIYLNAKQRKQYQISFKNGKLVDAKGNLFDTRGMSNGSSYYVLAKDGTFYTSTRKQDLKFEHSGYVAGADVICAGHIKVRDGKLLHISDMSAQYVAHPYFNLRLTKKSLESKGVSMSKVVVMNWVDYQ